MKKVAFFILLTLASACYAKTIKVAIAGSNTNLQPAIQSAVNSALNGDLIELPAGQYTINSNVLITKFISIKGAGLGKTVLYRSESVTDDLLNNSSSWRGIFRFNINSNNKSGIVVSDITFKSKRPSVIDGDGLSRAADIGIEMVNCVDFVITRCRFENFGNGAVSIMHDDSIVGGLISHNEFYHNVKGYDGLGLGYGVVVYGSNKRWLYNPRFGSSNFIFVEDNTFDYHRHSIAAGGCALYVFRHNTVKNNVAANTAHAIDAHEAALTNGDNYYATRAIEVYNNDIINTTFIDGSTDVKNGTPITPGKSVRLLVECAIRPRGGEAIIHDNYIEGYQFGVGLVNILSGTYPCSYQQGYLSGLKYGASHTGVTGDKGNGDAFIWNDKFSFYDKSSSQNVYFYNYSPNSIQNERDYHLYAKANYSTYVYPHPLANTVITDVEDVIGTIFVVYPNPTTNGFITVDCDIRSDIEVLDMNGTVVKRVKLLYYSSVVDVQDLPSGVYIIRILDKGFIKKIIIIN